MTPEWVAFCDDDDLWAPDKIIRQLKALDQSKCTWAYTGAVDINKLNVVTKGSPPPTPDTVVADLPKFNVIPGGCSGFSWPGRFSLRSVPSMSNSAPARTGTSG